MNSQILTLVVTTALTSILLQFLWNLPQGEAAIEQLAPIIQGLIQMKMEMKMQKMMMKMNKKMMKMQMATPRPMGQMPMFNVTMPQMKKKKKKNKNQQNNQPMMRGCFMKRRIIKVVVPKYKYVNVPYGKAVNPIDMRAIKFKKGINLGSVIEEPISSYSSGGGYR